MRNSFYESGENAAVYPVLNGKISVDYAVLGGSLCAAMTAYYLAEKGKSVALIAEDIVGGGDTGLLMPRADVSAFCYKKSRDALKELEKTGSGFKERGLFLFSDLARHEKRLRMFADAVDGEFYTPEEACEKFSFDVLCGVYAEHGSSVFSPVKTAKYLAGVVSLSGGAVFEKTPIMDIRNIGGYLISSPAGELYADKIADCREVLFDKREYGIIPYVCCSFDVDEIEGIYENCSLSDCYKKSLSFCFYNDRVYACVAVSPLFSLSSLYSLYKGQWICDIFGKMVFYRKIHKPTALFITYGKVLSGGEPVIKEIDKNFYASLCPYENGSVSAVMAAHEFIKLF